MRRNQYQVNLQKKKKRSRGSLLRNIGIALGALILSTLAINATDNVDNLSDSLLGQVITSTTESTMCPEGMSFVNQSDGGFCIDMYEASPNEYCEVSDPVNQEDTRLNLNSAECAAVSVKGVQPWRYIARHQAEQVCARVGKRLPTNREWYQASLGTPDGTTDNDCFVEGKTSANPILTGSRDRCISGVGAYDMIGNVWEWVDATVYDGELDGKALPHSGYVSSIDTQGVPIEVSETSDPNFNEDYFWIEQTGVRGMIRGGYFKNGSDAGQYAINAVTPPSFAGIGVGFRCAK